MAEGHVRLRALIYKRRRPPVAGGIWRPVGYISKHNDKIKRGPRARETRCIFLTYYTDPLKYNWRAHGAIIPPRHA